MTTATAPREEEETRSIRQRLAGIEQGVLVLGLMIVLIIVGALTTGDFLTTGNISIIPRLVAAIGIIAVGLAFVILGKGVDLSVGAMALVAGQVFLQLTGDGWSEWSAIGAVVLIAIVLGVVNGYVVAFLEVPPLFVTLATGPFLLGFVNVALLEKNLYTLPGGSIVAKLDEGRLLGFVPTAVIVAGVVFLISWAVWTYTSYGKMLRAVGDTADAARHIGIPVRQVQLSSYVISALLATLAGLVALARTGSAVTTGTPFSQMLFTALTVVVIGGVSLSGGKGSVLGVLVGALFVGVLNNLLTLHQLSSAVQDFIRGIVLVSAISLDAWLNPRDEETAKNDDL